MIDKEHKKLNILFFFKLWFALYIWLPPLYNYVHIRTWETCLTMDENLAQPILKPYSDQMIKVLVGTQVYLQKKNKLARGHCIEDKIATTTFQ